MLLWRNQPAPTPPRPLTSQWTSKILTRLWFCRISGFARLSGSSDSRCHSYSRSEGFCFRVLGSKAPSVAITTPIWGTSSLGACARSGFFFSPAGAMTRGTRSRDVWRASSPSAWLCSQLVRAVLRDRSLWPSPEFIGPARLCSFLTLAYFCLALFTQTAGNPTPQKLQRNIVYRICGYAILACILLIAVVNFLLTVNSPVQMLHPVFWLESTAVIAFGVAWLTKGEMILKD